MKQLLAILSMCLIATPVLAQEQPPEIEGGQIYGAMIQAAADIANELQLPEIELEINLVKPAFGYDIWVNIKQQATPDTSGL